MKKRIFILEDDEGIRELIHFLLEDQGYEVTSFSSVSGFCEYISDHKPDLVVLDIWLPDGSGRDVCKMLRANKRTEDLFIIIMTASSMSGNVTEANDFIPKPFDINDFILRIEKLFAEKEQRTG